MKPIFLFVFLIFAHSNLSGKENDTLFISNCNGHTVSFLIFLNNEAVIETYNSSLKTNNYSKKIKFIELSKIIKKENEIYTVKGRAFSKKQKCENYGDFSALYKGFENLTTAEKLNVCRNIFFTKNQLSKKTTLRNLIIKNYDIMTLETDSFMKKFIN